MDDPAHLVPDPALSDTEAETPEPASVGPVLRALPPFVPPPSVDSAKGLGWRMGVALGLIAFLIGVGATAFVMARLFKAVETKPTAVTLTTSNGQPPVVILPGRNTAPGPTIDLANLSTRQAELDAKLGTLEARTGTIDRESQRASGYATRAEGLMIAFAARRALDRGLNLGFLEEQLRDRFSGTQPAAVATIVQCAREPVTLEDLRVGLDGVAPELMTGARTSGWWPSLHRELGTLIVLRKAGTPSPLPIDRVARARRLLEAGQVEAALAEVSRTPGAAQAERWTGAARRYIGARRALDAIETAAILAPGVDAVAPAPTAQPAATPKP